MVWQHLYLSRWKLLRRSSHKLAYPLVDYNSIVHDQILSDFSCKVGCLVVL